MPELIDFEAEDRATLDLTTADRAEPDQAHSPTVLSTVALPSQDDAFKVRSAPFHL